MAEYILQRHSPAKGPRTFFLDVILIIRDIQPRYAIVINISRDRHRDRRRSLSGGDFTR